MTRFRVGPSELHATSSDARGLARMLEGPVIDGHLQAGHPQVAQAVGLLGDVLTREARSIREALDQLAQAVDRAAEAYTASDASAAQGAAQIRITGGGNTK